MKKLILGCSFMAAAPGWGADCGGLTPSLVFPATSFCGHEIPRTMRWLGSGRAGMGWEWESRKRDWGERIVPTLPWNEDAVQVLLCFAGTAHIILLHPEQSGLCGHFDLWTAPGSNNKWINHFWRKEMMVPLAELLNFRRRVAVWYSLFWHHCWQITPWTT